MRVSTHKNTVTRYTNVLYFNEINLVWRAYSAASKIGRTPFALTFYIILIWAKQSTEILQNNIKQHKNPGIDNGGLLIKIKL